MFMKAVCPNCKKRGVKEYKAINHDRPKEKGKPQATEMKRSCPKCHHGWFPKWEKEKAKAEK